MIYGIKIDPKNQDESLELQLQCIFYALQYYENNNNKKAKLNDAEIIRTEDFIKCFFKKCWKGKKITSIGDQQNVFEFIYTMLKQLKNDPELKKQNFKIIFSTINLDNTEKDVQTIFKNNQNDDPTDSILFIQLKRFQLNSLGSPYKSNTKCTFPKNLKLEKDTYALYSVLGKYFVYDHMSIYIVHTTYTNN